MRPLYDRLIVELEEIKKVTAGGIHLPEDIAKGMNDERDEARFATVKAVGDGQLLDDGTIRRMHISVGEKVLIRKYAGVRINEDEPNIIIVKEEDVLAVV